MAIICFKTGDDEFKETWTKLTPQEIKCALEIGKPCQNNGTIDDWADNHESHPSVTIIVTLWSFAIIVCYKARGINNFLKIFR